MMKWTTLFVLFYLSTRHISNSTSQLPNFAKYLRGTVFDFDCKHIYLVLYNDDDQLVVHKGLLNKKNANQMVFEQERPMEQVFPELFEAFNKTFSLSSLLYISSRSVDFFRITVLIFPNFVQVIKQFSNQTVYSSQSETRSKEKLFTISKCQSLPSFDREHFYFDAFNNLNEEIETTKNTSNIVSNRYVFWKSIESDLILISSYGQLIKEDALLEKDFRKLDLSHHKRGYWFKGALTLFKENFEEDIGEMEVWQICFSKIKVNNKMNTYWLEDFFKPSYSKHEKNHETISLQVLFSSALLVIIICSIFVCRYYYVFESTSSKTSITKKKQSSRILQPKTKKLRLTKYISYQKYSKLTSKELSEWIAPKRYKSNEIIPSLLSTRSTTDINNKI